MTKVPGRAPGTAAKVVAMCDHCSCRSFEPIADLSREHEEILALAWEVAEGRDATGERARALLRILDGHVRKEELGLYPWLSHTGDLTDEVLSRLEDEHVEVRAELEGGTFDRLDYYALAAHIEEEEMELFPAAMFAFDDDAWAALDSLVTS
ncbi:MAG TPA: hemerythrin domain-containing protein [Acidimicrobiales bacterium]|nr:hemerythrin domain-containing protein [Acidimicrobiales bacterium]